jgi:hypothetical protein
MSNLGTLKEYLPLVGFGNSGENLNMVVLPEPFGPITPSASPSSRCMLKLSIASSAPKRLKTPLSSSIAFILD